MRSRVQLLLATGLILSANVVRAAVITLTVGPTGQFASINAATSFADTDANPNNSYDILVAPGTYTNDFSNVTRPMTIEAATPGSQVLLLATVPPPNLKGIIWTDSSLTVNGLTFQGAAISSSDGGNGAGIRDQSNTATSLVVENSRFVGNQEGILTGSDSGQTFAETVIISNSQFINNGNPDPNVFQHALYVGDAASLTVTGSLFCGQVIGHDVKSRAASTTVTGSTLYVGTNQGAPAACNVGSASLAIDMPNGGHGKIGMDQIFQGDANQNGSLIRFGEEGLVPTFVNSLSVTNTTFDNLGKRASIGIDELNNCSAPVSGVATDTFTNVGTHVNPAGCVVSLSTDTATSDFNGDGYSDILWQNTSGQVAIWEMKGTTVIGGGSLGNPGPSWHAIATGDFNGDGYSDILWQNIDGEVAIWEMNGTSIIGGASLGNPGPSWHPIATGDFNGDGKSDILWQHTSGEVAIWEINGTTVIGGASLGNPGPSWHAIATGDFNGDGYSDILWQNTSGEVAIWEMKGTSIIGGASLGNPGPSWHAVATGDFNGDRHFDILWQNDSGQVAIWEMNGTSVIGGGSLGNPGPSWHTIGTGDFDGDRHSDILWQNDSGQVAIWEMNGTSVIGGGSLGNPGSSWHPIGK